MKTLKITTALAALAMLSGAALASAEHCVTRTIVANYVGGSMTSTQCFSHESNFTTPKKCESETKK